MERKTGARGLRGVIEKAMLDIMYEIPSKTNIEKCIVDAEVIRTAAKPKLILGTSSRKQLKVKKEGTGSAESA